MHIMSYHQVKPIQPLLSFARLSDSAPLNPINPTPIRPRFGNMLPFLWMIHSTLAAAADKKDRHHAGSGEKPTDVKGSESASKQSDFQPALTLQEDLIQGDLRPLSPVTTEKTLEKTVFKAHFLYKNQPYVFTKVIESPTNPSESSIIYRLAPQDSRENMTVLPSWFLELVNTPHSGFIRYPNPFGTQPTINYLSEDRALTQSTFQVLDYMLGIAGEEARQGTALPSTLYCDEPFHESYCPAIQSLRRLLADASPNPLSPPVTTTEDGSITQITPFTAHGKSYRFIRTLAGTPSNGTPELTYRVERCERFTRDPINHPEQPWIESYTVTLENANPKSSAYANYETHQSGMGFMNPDLRHLAFLFRALETKLGLKTEEIPQ